MVRLIGLFASAAIAAGVGTAAPAKDVVSTDYANIRAAVAACAAAGGGRVVVPAGRHLHDGPIVMKSGVELHLEDGAVVEFNDRLADYLPGVRVSWEGVECVNVSPLVYAYGCTNVAITGTGLFKPRLGFWKTWNGDRKPLCEKANRTLKNDWAPRGLPVDERRICDQPGAEFRPHFLHFNRCRNVRLDGFRVKGTPFWTIHLFLCADVNVRNLDIDAFDDDGFACYNSDGIDVECTRDVVIEGCSFCQNDDAIVLKSGKDHDGRRLHTPTENVTIRNCVVRRGHDLLAIGSELSGGIRNVHLHDCRVEGTVGRLVFLKTNPRRGGFLDGLLVEDVTADEVKNDAFGFITRYFYGRAGEEPLPDGERHTEVRGLVVRNVVCKKARQRIRILGDSHCPIADAKLENVRVLDCAQPDEIVNVKRLLVDGKAVPSVTRETNGPQY